MYQCIFIHCFSSWYLLAADNFLFIINISNWKKCNYFKLETVHSKKCSFLKFKNKSSWVKFIHFQKKTHLLTFELIFVSSSWRIYMYIKFDIKNQRLELYKKCSLFAYGPIQNNLDTLAFTLLKWNNENNSWVNFNSFT